jgi:hypothetical protein
VRGVELAKSIVLTVDEPASAETGELDAAAIDV